MVFAYNSIIKQSCDFFQNSKRYRWLNIKELAILATSEVGKSVNHLMNILLNLVEFCGFYCGIYFKRKRHRRVVEFFGTNVNRAFAFPYFYPIFAKTWIGENIYKSFFHLVQFRKTI